jgi:hypothetical protein
MPVPGRAWITLEQGEIWAGTGELVGERWRWRWTRESDSEAARDEFGLSRLYAIEVQSDGRGLAVGWGGAVLERSPDGTWRRIKTGFVDSLHAIAFPPSGYGDGTIVGGDMGEILTRIDGRYQLARQTDFADPLATATNNVLSGKIVGLALSGGSGDGDVEAWAASQVSGGRMRQPLPWALLHYGSGDPLLDPESRAGALPDAPAPEPGGLTLAAFGRSECQLGGCPPFQGTNLFNEVISRGIRAELTERRERTGEVLAAAFTGEISSSPGRQDRRNRATHTPDDANISHDQWRELAANPLLGDGIAVFGTPGERDLSGAEYCDGAFGCRGTRDHAPTGPTSQWRESFSTMPAPWGSGEPYSADGYEYRPVEGSLPKVDASSATGEQSANTHYAVDVVREEDDEPMARLVFADTSSAHSLAASDANQNPVEPQEAWLEEVLCQEGSAADTAALDCTRPAGLPAVVVTTTPTYSYGPGAIDGTQTEAASFESLLLRHEVTALVTGHLGWNGLYYTCAPGLHTPTPGGEHPAGPPGSAAECGGAAPGQTGELEPPDPSELSSDAGATGVLPTAIASSAGGRFGPTGNDEGGAADGFWHGYSVIRIPSDGDPRKVIVEQRPILDWIGITARDHVVGPRQRMTLEGYGREPLGTDTSVRMLEIDSHAITHRYDLLLADPDQPWLPCEESDTACTTLHANLSKGEASEENPCAPYLCLPRRIGTVDETTGLVRSGDGRYPETFALGMLSVGSKAATWPLVFERSPSFVTRSALRAPGAPQLNNVPTPGAPGQLPPPEVPQIPKIEVPAIPPPPAIPSLSATAPPEPTPPTPPAPPPPSQQPAPLDLSVAPPGVSISTPTALIQPPTPPVNPAPPGGARREARQRQAAAQKGGADNDASEGAEETQNAGGDKAMAPDQAMTRHESAMTRRAPTRAEPSFTTLAASDQPSAWSRGAFYGGGFLLVSATLALGFSTLRPTPRRRPPEVPAPATATYRWRRPRG